VYGLISKDAFITCCLYCNASYVGQTRRLLKNRIDEHRNHIKKKYDTNVCNYRAQVTTFSRV